MDLPAGAGLGCSAALFEPPGDEKPRPIGVNVRRQWAAWRGRDPEAVPSRTPTALNAGLAIVLGGLLLQSMWGGYSVDRQKFEKRFGVRCPNAYGLSDAGNPALQRLSEVSSDTCAGKVFRPKDINWEYSFYNHQLRGEGT